MKTTTTTTEIVKMDKNKTKLYGGYKRHTLNIKTKIGWKKWNKKDIPLANVKHKKT